MDYREKRQCRRGISRNASISLRPLDPQTWFHFWDDSDCFMRDISLVGAGIYFKEKVSVGTRLSIGLCLEKNAGSIRIFGKIAWIGEKEDDRYRAGVSFSWWQDDRDKKIVGSFVEKLCKVN